MRSPNPKLNYIRRLYAPQDALLESIEAELERLNFSWQMGAEECRLLQMLMQLHGTRKVVEVGTLAGYCAIWMARALPADGHVWTFERNPEHAAMAQQFIASSDAAEKITVITGDAHGELEQIVPLGPFDMMVIDAEKPGYNAYLDWALLHVRPGGLVVADNTLLFDTVFAPEPPERPGLSTWQGMQRFNERLADTRLFDAVMLPTDQGLSIAIKR